jgi:hypothetical protein
MVGFPRQSTCGENLEGNDNKVKRLREKVKEALIKSLSTQIPALRVTPAVA